ncbi:hypothetical protein L1987_12784 [Smallanthus sonchifolius]|uniref:Uncharacterized protein n=1 Tax=Smallanthus sonchifolius TaxID=185202 RepID=A0ACB9JF31_9ASTR|nr:hypothetical protein L1987_12784 [Smallanthus sonchifolius]
MNCIRMRVPSLVPSATYFSQLMQLLFGHLMLGYTCNGRTNNPKQVPPASQETRDIESQHPEIESKCQQNGDGDNDAPPPPLQREYALHQIQIPATDKQRMCQLYAHRDNTRILMITPFGDLPFISAPCLRKMEEVSGLQPVDDAHVPVIKFKFQGVSIHLLCASVSLLIVQKELSATLKKPLGDVYIENLTRSVPHVDGESSRKTKQLNEATVKSNFVNVLILHILPVKDFD